MLDSECVLNVLGEARIKIVKIIDASSKRPNDINSLLPKMPEGPFLRALERVTRGGPPDMPDLVTLLAASGANQKHLWETADKVRGSAVGDIVDIRGALEFSNYCRCDCLYCGLRRGNKQLPRYRMTEKEIISEAVRIREKGIRPSFFNQEKTRGITLPE